MIRIAVTAAAYDAISATLAIRRLSENRKDVISLRRVLNEVRKLHPDLNNQLAPLFEKLDSCDHVCGLVNDYVAHTGNPLRRPAMSDWNLQVAHLTEAQKAICEVANRLDRDLLRRKQNAMVVPEPQFDIMREFRCWVSEANITELRKFWYLHRAEVNAWIELDWS
jgi:hypothetical protein